MKKQFTKLYVSAKIFDQGVRSYFMSKKGKKNTRIINELLCDVK